MNITQEFEDMYGDQTKDSMGDWDEVVKKEKDKYKTRED